MPTPIRQLELEGRLLWSLAQGHLESIEELAQLTHQDLQDRLRCEPADVLTVFSKIDFHIDRKTQSKQLCPALPSIAEAVEIQYLDLEPHILKKLESLDVETLEELAFSSKDSFKEKGLQYLDILEIEFALSSFLDAYRKGKIVLQLIEEAPLPDFQDELKTELEQLDMPTQQRDRIPDPQIISPEEGSL